MNWVIISSGKGLLLVWLQAIYCTSVDVLQIGAWGTNVWNLDQNTGIFLKKNVFENVVCWMFTTLLRPQFVKKCIIITSASYYWLSSKLECLIHSTVARFFQLISPWLPSHRRYFRCIFVNEKFCILIIISLKFVPRGQVDNKPALV